MPLLVLMLLMILGGPAWAQEEATGILRVESSVEGAKVFVDFDEIGVTPLVEYLPVGAHTVRVLADNREPFVRRVEIFADATSSLDAVLRSGPGSVEFFVQPFGATIEVDGRSVGEAPLRLGPLRDGAYAYRIEAPNHETVEGAFEYAAGQNLLVAHRMESSAGRFQFNSTPEGATVWLDGEVVGETPLTLEGIAPGVHAVRLEADGYAAVLRTVDTTDGSKGEVSARLSEDAARVQIKADADDAQFSLDGQALAEGDRLAIALARGTYLLRIEADGREPLEDTIKVPVSGREYYKATLTEAGGGTGSSLEELPPMWARWYVWAGAGAGAAVVGGATWAIVRAAQPEPLPSGDVTVTLP